MNSIGLRYRLYLPVIFIFLFISCREEIISPNNPVGNLNQPVQTFSGNSYTFIINADNISNSVIDHLAVFTDKSRLFFSLNDYTAGAVQISLYNLQNDPFFRTVLSQNMMGSSLDLEGKIPNSIEIVFYDFTGKLKIQLTKID